MNIYIPIELKARELEGRSLLAIVAAERGHTVILGSKEDTLSLAKKGKLPPGIIHMKSITPHDSMLNMLAAFKENGHKISVQDEESGLLDHTYETFAKLRFSQKTLSQTSRIFAWGEFDGSSLMELYPEYSDNIVVTGSPRVDFWRKDFGSFFNNSSVVDEFGGKPYILIVSNFGSFLNENRFWNVMARLRQAGYFEREQGKELFEYENSAYQTRLIGRFVEMIRELSSAWPDHNIIVRPHPVESVDGWQKIIGDFPNVIVKREGTISKWIRHSKMIIHNGCTSALEAASSGVHRIAYRPIPDEIERDIPNSMSINTFSLEELKKVVSDILEEKNLDDVKKAEETADKLLRFRIANLQGKLAADRIVDAWETVEKEYELQQSSPSAIKQARQGSKASFKRRMKRKAVKVRDFLLANKKDQNSSNKLLTSDHKFPDFKDDELDLMLNNLRSALGRFENVTYERFGIKSFILTRKGDSKS